MSQVTYKIAAMTDVGLVRTNNEDNLCVISNLDVEGSTWRNNELCQLGKHGTLLVVADGMGGMNAGEVASEIAVSVVKQLFTERINDVNLDDGDSIVSFMNDAIVAADKAIKHEGRRRPEAKGMGTTIVIAWIIGEKLYVSWCGDSRAYLYNPNEGLFQISKDHSYVQELVDKGIVKPEDAFDFPESNVITRCLSHSSMKAVPDNLAAPIILSEGDIIMLCTDGLCGMIRDNEISSVIAANTGNMSDCVDALISAAKAASGADNVTVCLCQIISKTKIGRTDTSEIKLHDTASPAVRPDASQPVSSGGKKKKSKKSKRNARHPKLVAFIITLLIFAVAFFAFKYFEQLNNGGNATVATDSTAQNNVAKTNDTNSTDINPVDKNNDNNEVKSNMDSSKESSKKEPEKAVKLENDDDDSVTVEINGKKVKRPIRQRTSNIAIQNNNQNNNQPKVETKKVDSTQTPPQL